MPETRIDVAGRDDPLILRINGTDSNFRLQTDTIRAMARREISPRDEDLLEIASAVFFADSAISRGGPTRAHMGQAWHRTFAFTIPVHDREFWARPDVNEALVETVEFLTGDHVTFQFVAGQRTLAREPFLTFDPGSGGFQADEVILFSGGLDSFAGALETLKDTNRNVILLTHRSSQKAIPRQVKLGEYLIKEFGNRVLHIHVLARRKQQEASDSSQRSRSFLFAALGKVVAATFGAKWINFFENGVISHNLPISDQVVGTMATRTTHPLSLLKLDRLLQLVDPERPVPIENKYLWLTKRDVVERIAQRGGEGRIAETVSCTSIREQTTLHTHCGTCSQCLDRRFAILAAGLEEFDFATDYGTDVLFGPRERPLSATMAIEWTRHALRLSEFDDLEFMSRFGLELARIAEGHPELSRQAVLQQTRVMHARHGRNVEQVLASALSNRSADILHHRLPPTSLVSSYLSPQSDDRQTGLLPDRRMTAFRPPAIISGVEEDLVPDPAAPLRMWFSGSAERPTVSIEGLCDLPGKLASVPFSLKDDLLDDRTAGLAPCDHRFIASGELAQRLSSNKRAIRQRVKRCRDTLTASFRDIHKMDPDRDLLIQGQTNKGYRLDPEIELQSDGDSPGEFGDI